MILPITLHKGKPCCYSFDCGYITYWLLEDNEYFDQGPCIEVLEFEYITSRVTLDV